ncbi:MAG: transporter permease [Verrucomicrobiaceae bacterium]|nr:transporter permease [Verrucomicrobiaceae bacterium]
MSGVNSVSETGEMIVPPLSVPARATNGRGLGRWHNNALQIASLIVCILLWHVLATHHVKLGFITFANVPAPIEVVHAAWDLFTSPKLAFHLFSSLWRIAIGFSIAGVLGIALGLIIGHFAWAQNTLLPPLEVLRPIPAVAWIPLAILMFPSSEASMIYITFIGALFPILLNTIHGVEHIDARLIASARSLGTQGFALFKEVIFPAAAPSIVTGLSIGMGTCWFCLVTAEMISGQFGIGYYTWESYTLQNYANIIVGMLLIGVLGMGSSALIKQIGNWLMPWRRVQQKSGEQQ